MKDYGYVGDRITTLNSRSVPTDPLVLSESYYDPFGNLDCITKGAGSGDDCNPDDDATDAERANLLVDYDFDGLDRLKEYRSYNGSGAPQKDTDYVYDALSRVLEETESQPTRTTKFLYQGLTNQVTKEDQSGSSAKDKEYSYDAYGTRVSMTDVAANKTYTYGYDPHGSVSLLMEDLTTTPATVGVAKASYAYSPYGESNTTLSKKETGFSDPNPYLYSAFRSDPGSDSLDMGRDASVGRPPTHRSH